MHGMSPLGFDNDSPCRSELIGTAAASAMMKVLPAVGINAADDFREFGTSR